MNGLGHGHLYNQFSNQNLKLVESFLKHNETKKFMVSKVNDRSMNVPVIKIFGDGNCLFASLVHQLQYVKNNSDLHKKETSLLREKVVAFIKENPENYVQAVYFRSDYKGEKTVKDCVDFVSNVRSR